MKNIYLNFTFLLLAGIIHSQELPEIPMKNGMAYYSFEHKLDNNKKCLSKYFNTIDSPSESGTLRLKIAAFSTQLTSQQSKKYKSISFILVPPLNLIKGFKCIDTLKNSTGFTLYSYSQDILWRPLIIELLRKKTTGSAINAQVEVIFLSNTDYKLVFKDLTYKISWMQGSKNGSDIYNIGELYEQTKASGKISKSDIKFFEDLNFFIKSADEIILKALTETYRADEL